MEYTIRSLEKEDPVPYDLLLLADPSKAVIDEYIHRGQISVAVSHGEIIGIVVLLHTRPQTYEIVNLAVKEECQGKGIGKVLLRYALDQAKDQGATTMEIGTGNSSLDQLGFYQREGFRITGIDRDFFIKHYPDPIIENGIPCVDMLRLSKEV
ncbi:GNAT family N-acetyltransferase [Paenibacillus gallinarum]|uniref:GNAT family N-acetyltransferase n=1 Tax=Paenibacillus gallinarum TaxID=2762232 RepID=A0ABR8STZ5_9BACL|nr:GNAT family N-acetyltransferase [Paenibacillus gallinarum]MBD7966829.1 GNAT family N-acetyltransferase [Paenibacillus gallinarum]